MNAESSELALPATTLRLLRIGDTWAYKVVGTLTPPGTGPLDLTGQITVSIVSDRLLARSDSMAILFSQKFQIMQPDGSKQAMPGPEWMFSFVQDEATRDVVISADNMTATGAPRIAAIPQVFYPGSWSLHTAYNNRLAFDNGDHVNNILTVVGQEPVETDLGSFPSWKSKISSESAVTGLIEGTDWWTPDLGAPAKFSTISRIPDGSQMRFEATLTNTSVR